MLFTLTNNLPKLAHFAVTWALRTCRTACGLADVRYGPTFPRKLHLILTNQGTVIFTRCLRKIRTLLFCRLLYRALRVSL